MSLADDLQNRPVTREALQQLRRSLQTAQALAERTFSPEEYLHDTEGCARCGEPHTGLVTHWFARPIRDHYDVEEAGVEWLWWATCPATGDPLLIGSLPNGAND